MLTIGLYHTKVAPKSRSEMSNDQKNTLETCMLCKKYLKFFNV